MKKWFVSAAALRFMRSVLFNHFMGEDQHMIPCCGHFIVSSDDNQSVEIFGCCNGIDFDVLHEGENIVLRTIDSKTYCCSFYEYRDIALAFADKVERFFSDSPDRIVPEEEPDKSGFVAFKNEWFRLKDELQSDTPECFKNVSIDYSDYISITEKDILHISSDGISYKGGFINFRGVFLQFSS